MNTIIETPAEVFAPLMAKGVPDSASNERKAKYFLAMVQSMQVTTAEEFELAAEEVRKIQAAHKTMDDDRTSFTGPLNKVLDQFNARFMPFLRLLKGPGSAEDIIKRKMAAFQEAEQRRVYTERAEQERLAALERKRLADEAEAVRRKAEADAAAERKAEEARQALARAEQQRIEAEAAAVRGKAARAAAEARATQLRNEEAARQAKAEADAAEAKRVAEENAQALEATAAVVSAMPVVQAARVAGISTPKTVDYEVTDKAEFLRFALETRPDLLDLWEPDAAKMRALVKLQGLATHLPGLRVFPKTGITVR